MGMVKTAVCTIQVLQVVMHCLRVVWTWSLGLGSEFWRSEYGWTGLQQAGRCTDSAFASGI